MAKKVSSHKRICVITKSRKDKVWLSTMMKDIQRETGFMTRKFLSGGRVQVCFLNPCKNGGYPDWMDFLSMNDLTPSSDRQVEKLMSTCAREWGYGKKVR